MMTTHNPTLLASILQGNEGVWCDDVLTPGADVCSTTARMALDKALKDLTERMGKDMAKWRWGDIHKTQFPHNPFSQVAFLKSLLFHRSIETGGDGFTVNPAPFKLANPYDSQHLPSYREIIDLADLSTARFIQTTGQSGHPLSKHYARPDAAVARGRVRADVLGKRETPRRRNDVHADPGAGQKSREADL